MADIVIGDEVIISPRIKIQESPTPPFDESKRIAQDIQARNEQLQDGIRQDQAEDIQIEPKQDPLEWKKRMAQTKGGSISNRYHKHSRGSPDREKDDQEYRYIKSQKKKEYKEVQYKIGEGLQEDDRHETPIERQQVNSEFDWKNYRVSQSDDFVEQPREQELQPMTPKQQRAEVRAAAAWKFGSGPKRP